MCKGDADDAENVYSLTLGDVWIYFLESCSLPTAAFKSSMTKNISRIRYNMIYMFVEQRVNPCFLPIIATVTC